MLNTDITYDMVLHKDRTSWDERSQQMEHYNYVLESRDEITWVSYDNLAMKHHDYDGSARVDLGQVVRSTKMCKF